MKTLKMSGPRYNSYSSSQIGGSHGTIMASHAILLPFSFIFLFRKLYIFYLWIVLLGNTEIIFRGQIPRRSQILQGQDLERMTRKKALKFTFGSTFSFFLFREALFERTGNKLMFTFYQIKKQGHF